MADLDRAAVWHRQVAALSAAAERAGVTDGQLPTVRARLLNQQTRFAEATAGAGDPMPALIPSPGEVTAAAPGLGDLSAATVAEALRTALSTLDAVDADLAAAGTAVLVLPGSAARAGGSRSIRNGLVYGCYALGVLVIQLVLLALLDEERTLPLLAPLCLFGLPAMAWAAGWLTIGTLFGSRTGDTPVKRSPRLGAVICLTPNLLLCAGILALFLADRVSRG